jgi:7-cyano-7-deazaguanine tRNA-ribosyltransferase
VFSTDRWDGLAKIGEYQKEGKEFKTPALFPVVDPLQQDIAIKRMQTEFGLSQVITSAYLMSKRIDQGNNWASYPKVHDYLDFEGTVMMDSGAYQVLLYGDIELGVLETLELQEAVQTDIGVLMDHPIAYDTSYPEAMKRNATTISNIQSSMDFIKESRVHWTLPIQGGKHIDLLSAYIDQVKSLDIMENFSMFALGSVVPVMINQDYVTLVKMIATARAKLPVTYPLHLFGAGHPAMFALSTFLGCDTYDSAAYALMAKDSRYMTVEGTYQLAEIDEFPCVCKVCVSHTPKELRDMDRILRRSKLAEHNLWVSTAEIKRIHHAIKMGRLWDLVQQRAGSVPQLARATRLALKYASTGKLKVLYEAGIPVSNPNTVRVARSEDIKKIELQRITSAATNILMNDPPKKLTLLAYSMEKSIYLKLPLPQIEKLVNTSQDTTIALLLPPFGIVPISMNEYYPVGQLVHELNIDDFDKNLVIDQLRILKDVGLEHLTLIFPYSWPKDYVEDLLPIIQGTEIIYTDKPLDALTNLVPSRLDD